jgi:hypothetical protein
MDTELEELLKIANTVVPEEKKLSSEDPILQFLHRYNILVGEERVPSRPLYNLFRMTFPDTSFTRTVFSRRLSKYIPSYQTSFYINKTALNINATILENEPVTPLVPSKQQQNKFQLYLDHYGFKPGDTLVPANLLYFLYVKYLNNTKKKRKGMDTLTLNKLFKMKFEHKIIKSYLYFMLDNTTFETILTPEIKQQYEEKTSKKKK